MHILIGLYILSLCPYIVLPFVFTDTLYPWIPNAQSFRERTGSFRKILKKHAEFVFISAPNVVPPMESAERAENETTSDDQRGWWFSRDDDYFSAGDTSDVSKGFDKSLQVIEKAFTEEGPFDGVLGFSQGATLVGMLCAIKDEPGSPFHFDFAILVAGFRSLSTNHDKYYSKPISCPTLQVFGDTDKVIPKEWSVEHLKYFIEPETLSHTGGHFIPASSPQKKIYLEYLQKWLDAKRLKLKDVEES
ncbi:esterase OVCA2-like isoform X2 [Ptychodera flava]|uniref:esterase OVCA2-like isoform X2 n=1 Tax=Ptychodera flava TaxID=63121 RepID=UPI00396A66F9